MSMRKGRIQKLKSEFGPDNVFFFFFVRGGGERVIDAFHTVQYNLPPKAIGPLGSNCFQRWVPISISKVAYSHL